MVPVSSFLSLDTFVDLRTLLDSGEVFSCVYFFRTFSAKEETTSKTLLVSATARIFSAKSWGMGSTRVYSPGFKSVHVYPIGFRMHKGRTRSASQMNGGLAP